MCEEDAPGSRSSRKDCRDLLDACSLGHEARDDERIPSVRELAISIGVNPNTVARSYEFLQNSGVIYNKRGIGYFVAQDARELIIQTQKKEFLNEQLPNIIKKMKLLGITPDIIEDNFNNYKL